MSNVACQMALQELAQMSDWRQQLESELHDINLRETAHIRRNFAYLRRHRALSKELATENQQHGDTKQQLSAAKQDNLQLADELKVGLLVLPVLCCDCVRAKVEGVGEHWRNSPVCYSFARLLFENACWICNTMPAKLGCSESARPIMCAIFRSVFLFNNTGDSFQLSLITPCQRTAAVTLPCPDRSCF